MPSHMVGCPGASDQRCERRQRKGRESPAVCSAAVVMLHHCKTFRAPQPLPTAPPPLPSVHPASQQTPCLLNSFGPVVRCLPLPRAHIITALAPITPHLPCFSSSILSLYFKLSGKKKICAVLSTHCQHHCRL